MKPIYIIIGAIAFLVLATVFREIYLHVTWRKQCPACGNKHPDRIKRPSWAKAIRFVSSQAFHCLACGNRYIQVGADSHRVLQEYDIPKAKK